LSLLEATVAKKAKKTSRSARAKKRAIPAARAAGAPPRLAVRLTRAQKKLVALKLKVLKPEKPRLLPRPSALFVPVVLAGGSGTRFWPRSRRAHPKQVLALNSAKSMIQETVERLLPLAAPERFWVITNEVAAPVIRKQVPRLKKAQILAEPAARNTAPAIGLAAFLLHRKSPDAVLGLFPSDHVIKDAVRFREDLKRGIEIAASGEKMVVLGVLPTRPETGYGYIECGAPLVPQLFRVKRFTEKPGADQARRFIAEGNYYWNSGMFLWSARTLVRALREHLPQTAEILERIAKDHGSPRFAATFRRLYPKCQNISVDYAVLEPRSAKGEGASGLFCITTDFGWNDLGSWAALYEHRASDLGVDANVIEAAGAYVEGAALNLISAPERFVAAIGVRNLIVVETKDALLLTTRQHSQEVGNVVRWLKEHGKKELL
jgi:mannose-1-phosphate guanylyltransferase